MERGNVAPSLDCFFVFLKRLLSFIGGEAFAESQNSAVLPPVVNYVAVEHLYASDGWQGCLV